MCIEKTERGFAILRFEDSYGISCSLQKSSIATRDSIWLGVDDPNPKILANLAEKFGIYTKQKVGWIEYPIPKEVSLITRMHLNREQVTQLIPVLQKFVDTGELE